jgi:uncharacterized membrane protein YbaN (DUF454 family)
MKELWVAIGLLTMAIGIVGIVLPILPTTPFFLVTAYSFTKGSTRFHDWFTSRPFVRRHLLGMHMTRRKKWTLLLSVDTLLIVYMVWFDSLVLRIVLLSLIVIKHIVFHTYVRVE